MLAVLVTLAACGTASALSSKGTAVVTRSGDRPCFGVESDGGTAPSRLYSLSITEVKPERGGDWRSLPEELWGFDMAPPGLRLEGPAGACVRYADLPPKANARSEPRPLQPGRTYRVEMSARPQDGREPTRSYEIDFCLKAGAGGTTEVRSVAWDEAARRWRDEVCAAR